VDNVQECNLLCVIVGEMLFNANYPAEPPDFIFTGNDNQFQPDVAEIKVIVSAFADSVLLLTL